MDNLSAPILQFAENPDRKTCLPLAIFLSHPIDSVELFPDNQRPILPQGLARGLPLYLVSKSLIGSFA
jgi:hypothetical protein